MTGEETNQFRDMLRKSPRTFWEYWPSILPVLIAIACAVAVVGFVIYWETKMPDLEVLFRRGEDVAPIADSQLVREAVMSVAFFNASGEISNCYIRDAFARGILAVNSPNAVLTNNTVIRCPVQPSKDYRMPANRENRRSGQ